MCREKPLSRKAGTGPPCARGRPGATWARCLCPRLYMRPCPGTDLICPRPHVRGGLRPWLPQNNPREPTPHNDSPQGVRATRVLPGRRLWNVPGCCENAAVHGPHSHPRQGAPERRRTPSLQPAGCGRSLLGPPRRAQQEVRRGVCRPGRPAAELLSPLLLPQMRGLRWGPLRPPALSGNNTVGSPEAFCRRPGVYDGFVLLPLRRAAWRSGNPVAT